MDNRFPTLEARKGRLGMQSNVKMERNEKARSISDDMRAVATGFKDDTKEDDAEVLLEKAIDAAGMKKECILIKCPAKPITYAFPVFKESEERDKYFRSANMQQVQFNERKLKISTAMDAAERYHHKRLGYIKRALRNRHKIPLERIIFEPQQKKRDSGRTDLGQNV